MLHNSGQLRRNMLSLTALKNVPSQPKDGRLSQLTRPFTSYVVELKFGSKMRRKTPEKLVPVFGAFGSTDDLLDQT